jgi:hypothetical protein
LLLLLVTFVSAEHSTAQSTRWQAFITAEENMERLLLVFETEADLKQEKAKK